MGPALRATTHSIKKVYRRILKTKRKPELSANFLRFASPSSAHTLCTFLNDYECSFLNFHKELSPA